MVSGPSWEELGKDKNMLSESLHKHQLSVNDLQARQLPQINKQIPFPQSAQKKPTNKIPQAHSINHHMKNSNHKTSRNAYLKRVALANENNKRTVLPQLVGVGAVPVN